PLYLRLSQRLRAGPAIRSRALHSRVRIDQGNTTVAEDFASRQRQQWAAYGTIIDGPVRVTPERRHLPPESRPLPPTACPRQTLALSAQTPSPTSASPANRVRRLADSRAWHDSVL